jgi:hypothetical protein
MNNESELAIGISEFPNISGKQRDGGIRRQMGMVLREDFRGSGEYRGLCGKLRHSIAMDKALY